VVPPGEWDWKARSINDIIGCIFRD